jgi:hypothetical protein
MRSSGVIFQGVDIEEIAMQHARNYGVAAKEHIRLQNSASIVRKLNKGSQFAVTRLTSPSSHHGMTTPIPPEKSFAISLQLIDFPKGELWLDGNSVCGLDHDLLCFIDVLEIDMFGKLVEFKCNVGLWIVRWNT